MTEIVYEWDEFPSGDDMLTDEDVLINLADSLEFMLAEDEWLYNQDCV